MNGLSEGFEEAVEIIQLRLRPGAVAVAAA
jgi:hypothetical protein